MIKSSSLLVLNYNGKHLLAEYLPSVVEAVKYDGGGHKVVVVDNASTDDSVEFVREHFPILRVRVMAENRRLFSYNDVVAECDTDYVILLNNDVRVKRDFIAPLLRHFDDPQVFAVMPKVLSDKPGERFLYRCPGRFECGVMATGRDEQLEGPGYTLFAHGGAAACDRKKFLALGGFDPLYWPGYSEDNDLSYMAWMRGWTVIFEPQGEVFHFAGGTFGNVYTSDSKRRQREKVCTLFVLKNIADERMLADFFFWSAFRLGKAVVTFDRVRLGAFWDVVRLLPLVWRTRMAVQSSRVLSDVEILRLMRQGHR